MFVWTETRVERLKAHWAEGWPASAIAAEMGGGLTRNAIIGKVHRLGLPLRGKRVQRLSAEKCAAIIEDFNAKLSIAEIAARHEISLHTARGFVQSRGLERKRIKKQTFHVKRPPAPPRSRIAKVFDDASATMDNVVAFGPRCSLVDLTKSTCRFPIGDVGAPDFAFCAGEAVEGLPYCIHHARIAYRDPIMRQRPGGRRPGGILARAGMGVRFGRLA